MLHLPMVGQVNGNFFTEQYTLSIIQPPLQPLVQDTICKSFLPHLTEQITFSCLIRDLLALPTQLGGLGIVNVASKTGAPRGFLCYQSKSMRKHLDMLYIMVGSLT